MRLRAGARSPVVEKIETACALRRPAIGTSESGQRLKQFVDRKASRGRREGDNRRSRVASAANVSLPFPPLVFFGRSPSQVLVPSYEGIDNTATEKTRCPRQQNSHPSAQVAKATAVGYGIDRQTHVDDRNEIEICQTVEHQAAVVIIRATEDNVAGFHCVTAPGIADPVAQWDDTGANTQLRDLSRNDIHLRAHGVSVGPARTVKPVEIGHLDNVVIEQYEPTDSQPREEHGSRAPGSATAHNADPHGSQPGIERSPEDESLTREKIGVGSVQRRRLTLKALAGNANVGSIDGTVRVGP